MPTNTLDNIIVTKDKDGLDAYAAEMGVTLDKRRSFENMLSDFKAHTEKTSAPAPSPVPAMPAPAPAQAPEPAGEPTMEVLIIRNYRPMDPQILNDLGRATDGVRAKLFKGEMVELPMKEAKRAITAGIATFPPQTI